MSKQNTDLTFFTNTPNQTLLDRFKSTLSDTQLFDVPVGYFRSNGFYQLYDSIEPVEKTRILVGLGIDESNRAINAYRTQTVLDFESHKNAKDLFQQTLIEEIEQSEEADDKLELGLKKFIEFLKAECADSAEDRNRGGNGRKLEIRAFPSRNIHAKVYIGRFAPDDRDYGFVVTGSSNFSYSGLVANREFNVELRQRRDVEYALEQLEDLWQQSVDISDDFVDAVQKKTWLNDSITPYELYLKLIYEYLQEDINLQDDIEFSLNLNHRAITMRAITRIAPTGHCRGRLDVSFRHSNPLPRMNISRAWNRTDGRRSAANYGNAIIGNTSFETKPN